MNKDDLQFTWAGSPVLDSLEPYVREIQEKLAEITGQAGILDAFMSDESGIWNFLADREFTGEERPHPFDKDKTCKVVSHDTPKNREIVRKLSEALGVEAGIYDPLYEVALRLRDQ